MWLCVNGRRVIVRRATIWTSQDFLCARIWKLILSRQTKKGAGKISSAPFSWMKSIRIFRFKQRKNFSQPLDGNFHLRQSSCSPRKLLWVHVEAYAFLWFFFFYPIFTETWNFDVVFKRIFRKEWRIKKEEEEKKDARSRAMIWYFLVILKERKRFLRLLGEEL